MFADEKYRIMEQAAGRICRHCRSGNLKRNGVRRLKAGDVQEYRCRSCGKKSTDRVGFEGRHVAPAMITRAINSYYAGSSIRDIVDGFLQEGAAVGKSTIYRWVSEYSKRVSDYVDSIRPRLDGRPLVRADEA